MDMSPQEMNVYQQLRKQGLGIEDMQGPAAGAGPGPMDPMQANKAAYLSDLAGANGGRGFSELQAFLNHAQQKHYTTVELDRMLQMLNQELMKQVPGAAAATITSALEPRIQEGKKASKIKTLVKTLHDLHEMQGEGNPGTGAP